MRAADKKELYVCNLPQSMLEEEVHLHFGTFGKIKEVRSLKDANGKSKCTAFITFEEEVFVFNQGPAKKVLALNGTMLQDRILAISIVDPNRKYTRRQEQIRDKLHGQDKSRNRQHTSENFYKRSSKKKLDITTTTSERPVPDDKPKVKPVAKMTQDDFRKFL